MDIVAATAAESRALADVESMKMAARKINLRIITLYSIAVLTASFVVPMDHPFINGQASSVSARSVFIIAAVEAGMPKVAHFFNAVFVFSAFTCGINSMYIAARVLHTLALRGQTGPEFITKRLRACRSGVPVRAVLVTGALMMVAYMGRSGAPGAVSTYPAELVSLCCCYPTPCVLTLDPSDSMNFQTTAPFPVSLYTPPSARHICTSSGRMCLPLSASSGTRRRDIDN